MGCYWQRSLPVPESQRCWACNESPELIGTVVHVVLDALLTAWTSVPGTAVRASSSFRASIVLTKLRPVQHPLARLWLRPFYLLFAIQRWLMRSLPSIFSRLMAARVVQAAPLLSAPLVV